MLKVIGGPERQGVAKARATHEIDRQLYITPVLPKRNSGGTAILRLVRYSSIWNLGARENIGHSERRGESSDVADYTY
jgi:hypothetical protein